MTRPPRPHVGSADLPLTRGKAPFSAEAREVCLLNPPCGGEPACACKTPGVGGGGWGVVCAHMLPWFIIHHAERWGVLLQTVDSCVQQCKQIQLDLLSNLQQCSVGNSLTLLPPHPATFPGCSSPLVSEEWPPSHITNPIMMHSNLVHSDFMSHQNGPSGHFVFLTWEAEFLCQACSR